ncbi:MAG: M23 family metallopeptidase [Clostridia bacterium]|nr:M23 family metallopeptidase [Clostridia bacterium]
MLENIYTTKMSTNKKALQTRFTKIRSKTGKLSKLMACTISIVLIFSVIFATVVLASIETTKGVPAEDEPITLYSKGNRIVLQNKPFVQDNIVYLPLRETFEKLGFFDIPGNTLEWKDGEIFITAAETAGQAPVYYSLKINSEEIGISHEKNALVRLSLLNLEPSGSALLIGQTTYVPYDFIEYMLNRGLGVRNRQYLFDFVITVNTPEISAAFLSQRFILPCDGEISATYGTRVHPITGETKTHNGIDIIAPDGTPVVSTIYGTVTTVGYDAEKGNYIIVQKDNVQTAYHHLKEIQVSTGDTIQRGQIIGTVGSTGTSVGSYLHFEIQINGIYYDPEHVL